MLICQSTAVENLPKKWKDQRLLKHFIRTEENSRGRRPKADYQDFRYIKKVKKCHHQTEKFNKSSTKMPL